MTSYKTAAIFSQSNGPGRSLVSNLSNPESYRSRCLLYKRLSNSNFSQDVNGAIVASHAGYETHPTQGKLFGLEVSLGQKLGSEWCIASFGFGNTEIADWLPGASQYTAAKASYDAFNSVLENAGHSQSVDVIYWLQGEKDSRDQTKAGTYTENLTTIIASLRSDYADVPVIIVKTSPNLPSGDYPYNAAVVAAQQSVADADTSIIAIDSAGYAMRSDEPYHYASSGSLQMGLDIYEKMISLDVI